MFACSVSFFFISFVINWHLKSQIENAGQDISSKFCVINIETTLDNRNDGNIMAWLEKKSMDLENVL